MSLQFQLETENSTSYSLEYIWMDVNNKFRSKVKVIAIKKIKNIEELKPYLEVWNFDGSSTGQASTGESEVFIKPFRFFKNTEIKNYYYVLCECLNPDGTPHKTNTRSSVSEFFKQEKIKELDIMFGIEQEFFVFKKGLPLVWNNKNDNKNNNQNDNNTTTEPQGDYYCGNGAKLIEGRDYLNKVVEILTSIGINITGYNFEVAPGQMEIQICHKGIDACDYLIVSRFILTRLAEERGWDIDFSPKPTFLNTPNWNGSGCHVNISTKQIRDFYITKEETVLNPLYQTAKLITKMQENHSRDIASFGSELNKLRLTGINETSSYDKFTYGIAHRGCSIRIPRTFVKNLKGYIEDRRPSSDMDPYVVCKILASYLLETNTEIEDKNKEEIKKISMEIINKNYNDTFNTF